MSSEFHGAEKRICATVVVLILVVVSVNSGFLSSSSGNDPSSSPSQARSDFEDGSSPSPPSSSSSIGSSSYLSALDEALSQNQQQQQRSGSADGTQSISASTSSFTPVGVYDGNPFFTPIPVEARNSNLSTDFIASIPHIDPDDSSLQRILPPLSQAEVQKHRFAVMARNIPAGLGLTTQLLTYMHLLAAAQLSQRTLIFPVAKRTPWFTLVNMSATTFPGGRPLSYVATRETGAAAVKTRSVARTNFKWSRELTYGIPLQIHRQIVGFAQRTSGVQVVRFPSMFKMYPFAAEPRVNFGKLTCGLVFHNKIEEWARLVIDEMHRRVKQLTTQEESETGQSEFEDDVAATNASSASVYYSPSIRYISVHLRIEPQDSVAFRRGAPTPSQLRSWFVNVVAPLCAKHRTRNVFVASGPLGKDYDAVLLEQLPIIKSINKKTAMRIFTKQQLLSDRRMDSFFDEERTTVGWSGRKIYPTNTRTAAIDALVLQHGVATVMTAFSSLTALTFSRRCFHGPRCLGAVYGKQGSSSSNYLYEVADDGAMTKARPFRCGYRMQELVRGGGVVDPPSSEDLFAENVRNNRTAWFGLV